MPDLLIDDLTIPFLALGDHRQTYEYDRAEYDLMMADGAVIRQTRRGRKLMTTLSGSGWMPAGLDGLDTAIPHLVACVAPQSVVSSGRVLTLPAARRQDVPVAGWATLASGAVVAAPVDMVVAGVVTLDLVAGAVTYAATYYPRILAWIGYSSEVDLSGAAYAWTLTAREA